MVEEAKKDESFLEKAAEVITEEIKDFKRTGSVGGYLADKATDLAVKGAEKLGANGVAQIIEENRDPIVDTLGGAINLGLSSGLSALTSSEKTDKLADGLTNAAVKSAEKLGADGIAQVIENNREVINEKTSNLMDKASLALRKELLDQKGEIPDNPIARSQNMRIQMRIDEREHEKENKQEQTNHRTIHQTTITPNLISSYERA